MGEEAVRSMTLGISTAHARSHTAEISGHTVDLSGPDHSNRPLARPGFWKENSGPSSWTNFARKNNFFIPHARTSTEGYTR
ncbi:hypothetical protein GE21DRAFT_1323991 [Neurospora crassa]|nr:hypothetical protein GE21DRAFT_1323991 [Neurospora crassa]